MRIYTFLRKGGTIDIVADDLREARRKLVKRGFPFTLIFLSSREKV